MGNPAQDLKHCGACGNDVWPASELGLDGQFRDLCPKCGAGMQAEVIPLPVAAPPPAREPVAPAAQPQAPASPRGSIGVAEAQYINATLEECEALAATINDRIRRIRALVQ